MSNTVKQLGFIPTNRGEYDTTGQTRYYKDNVVQYRNGSYICTPVGYSSSNLTAYTTDAPYQDGDTQLNPNWKLMASVGLVDEEPTASSDNLVKSGGVQNELALGAVYDVSAKNPTAGPNSDGKWESLSALLSDANLSTLIPIAVRKGGMSIKFVQSSDNKYVEYFLTKDEWSASEADWEKLNLEEDVSQLGQEVLGGDVIEAELNLGNPTDGYYTGRVGETVGETTSNGYKYAAYSLDAYVGKHLVLTIPGASSTSTSRRICICNSAGTIIILYSEAAAADAPFEVDIQEGYYLYVSRQSNNGYTATITSHTDGLKDRVEGLEGSVNGLQEGLSDLEENVTEEINGLQDDLSELENEINGGTTTTTITPGTRSSGYYKGNIGETIQETTSSGRKETPIDLSDYVGQTIRVSLTPVSPTTAKTRIVAICNANGVIIDKKGEGYFFDGSEWEFQVESGMYLYVSYDTAKFSSENIVATKVVKGYSERIDDIAKGVEDKFNGVYLPVQIVCDNNSAVARNDFKYCSFCKSESSVIRGEGNSTILVNVNTQELTAKDVISVGFLASFGFQDVASITLNGRLVEKAENYSYTESGKLYHIDGDSFNRFNMYADGAQTTLTIQVTAESDVEWELLIANKVTINDCMDVAPICLCYDGGSWDGKVIYNNEQISLWRFHEIMGFPYTICFDPNTNSIDNFNEIVKEHISSGFATLMLRHVPYTIGSQHQQPTELELVNKIREEFGLAAFSTSRACVLGQHHFDRKIRRCMTKVGVRALRIQAAIDNYQGYISRLPGDADILCINTCAVNNSIGTTDIPFKFPRIAFAHGVGIPPEGESGYADSTGTVTPATFARLKELQESGDVEILNVTDWVAKCGF